MIITNKEIEQRMNNIKMKKYVTGLVVGIICTLLCAILFNFTGLVVSIICTLLCVIILNIILF